MAWTRYTHASIDSQNPQALAACDRCGFIYNHRSLAWQNDWRGPRLQNLRILVCPTCMDAPQENGQRSIIIPPDPIPINNPRTDANMITGFGPQYGPELVNNGGFTSSYGWTLVRGAVIEDGVLVIIYDNLTGTSVVRTTAADTIVSGTYRVSLDVVYNSEASGTVRFAVGGSLSDFVELDAGYSTTYTTEIVSVASSQLIIMFFEMTGAQHQMAVDNLSVVKVL